MKLKKKNRTHNIITENTPSQFSGIPTHLDIREYKPCQPRTYQQYQHPALMQKKNIVVQVLTQKDFDAMTPTRQAFIRDRIKAGQVKIVDQSVITPPTPPKSTQTKRGPNPTASQLRLRARAGPPESSMPMFLNKLIRLFLTTGQNRTGILTNIYQYDVVIETKDGQFVILKHAIVSIELARFYQPPPTASPTTTECTKLTYSIHEHD